MKKYCPKASLFVYAVIAITCVVSWLSAVAVAVAQETQRTFTVSPPSVNFELKPGQETERQIKVTNQSDEAMDFVVELKDFVVTDDKGTPELLPVGTLKDNKFAASTWAASLPDSFSVAPGKSEVTTLYLRVPQDARPGGRYFSVAFRPIASADLESSGAAVNTVIGSLVYLTVAGPMTEAVDITKFFAPKLSEFGPVTINTEIFNSGDIHANPKATIEINNLFGKKVYGDVLRSANIFPNTARVYENTWNKKWLFGRYQAGLAGYYGSNNMPLLANAVFWVIPYRLILGVILALIIAGMTVMLIKSRKPNTPAVNQ